MQKPNKKIVTPKEMAEGELTLKEVYESKRGGLPITALFLKKKHLKEMEAMETKFFQFQGMIMSQVDVIAWDIRQKARIDAAKLLGHYPADRHELTGPEGGPIEVGEAMDLTALKAAKKAVKKKKGKK